MLLVPTGFAVQSQQLVHAGKAVTDGAAPLELQHLSDISQRPTPAGQNPAVLWL